MCAYEPQQLTGQCLKSEQSESIINKGKITNTYLKSKQSKSDFN